MPELLNMFSGLIDENTDISYIPNNEIENPMEIPPEPEKKKKGKRTKKPKAGFIVKPYDFKPLSKFDFGILETTEVEAIVIDGKPTKAPRQQTIYIDPNDNSGFYRHRLRESWRELHLFLIGAACQRYTTEFISKAAEYGVFNNDVILTDCDKLYSDHDLDDRIAIYNIPFTSYRVDIYFNASSNFESIVALIKLLGFTEKSVSVWLIRKDLDTLAKSIIIVDVFGADESDYDVPIDKKLIAKRVLGKALHEATTQRKKATTPKTRKKPNKRILTNDDIELDTIDIQGNDEGYTDDDVLDTEFTDALSTISLEGYVNNGELLRIPLLRLTEFLEKALKDGIGTGQIKIVYLEFLDLISSVDDWTEFGAFLCTFISMFDKDKAKVVLKDISVKDEIGVVDDGNAYLGIMKSYSIQGLDLWFYTNGNLWKLAEWCNNLISSMEIPSEDISIAIRIEN